CEATSNAINNTMPAMTNRTGHNVISSSAKTVCSAVNIVTGGIATSTRSSGSSPSPPLTPGTWETASSIIDIPTSATGAKRNCSSSSVEFSAIGSTVSIRSRNASMLTAQYAHDCSKVAD